jgi:hypothetical protein
MDLNHRVVAAVGGTPKRVECLTCHTQHNYRAPKGAKDPVPKGTDVPVKGKKAAGTTKAKTTKISKANAARGLEWDKRVLGQIESSFTVYTPRTHFKLDELIRHSKFGDGFVSEVNPDGKIAVIFREGPKTLVHGR